MPSSSPRRGRSCSGHSQEVQEHLARRMQELSERLEFESAALLRDRIRALTQVQGRQDINVQNLGDADVIAAHQAGGQTSIQVFFFRGGQNWGNRAYFPSHDQQLGLDEVLAAFIGQFYDNKPPPPVGPDQPRAGRPRRFWPRRCRPAPAARSSW